MLKNKIIKCFLLAALCFFKVDTANAEENLKTKEANLTTHKVDMFLADEKLFLETGNQLDLKSLNILNEPETLINHSLKQQITNSLEKHKENSSNNQFLVVIPGSEVPGVKIKEGIGRIVCDSMLTHINPGIEVPDIESNEKNDAQECSSVPLTQHYERDNTGRKLIGFNLSRFQSVGILVSYKQNEPEICNFVLISTEWIITAKHCVINNKEFPKAWLLMTADSILDDKAKLKFDGCQSDLPAPHTTCTYHKLKLSSNQLPQLWKDNADLALLKIDEKSLPEGFVTNSIPKLDFSNSNYDIVTLVGVGNSNVAGYNNRRPQVGWFRGDFTNDNYNLTFLDPSIYDSKPAPGDSGGPLYRGEYFGWPCTYEIFSECRVYLLSGIISGGVGTKTITSTVDVQNSKTKVTRLAPYKEFICSNSKRSIGCNENKPLTLSTNDFNY